MTEDKRPKVVVGALIMNKKKEILLVKSSSKWKWVFYIPGGHVEEGERVKDALEREIAEEVGLKIKILEFLGVQEGIFPPLYYKRKHFIFLDYLCQVVGSEKVTPDKREVEEFIWVKPEKALKMKTDPYTRKTIKVYLSQEK